MIRRPPRSTLFPYTTLFRSPLADRGFRDPELAGYLGVRLPAVDLKDLDHPLVDLVEYARARGTRVGRLRRPVRSGIGLSGHPAHLCVRGTYALEGWFEFRLTHD